MSLTEFLPNSSPYTNDTFAEKTNKLGASNTSFLVEPPMMVTGQRLASSRVSNMDTFYREPSTRIEVGSIGISLLDAFRRKLRNLKCNSFGMLQS